MNDDDGIPLSVVIGILLSPLILALLVVVVPIAIMGYVFFTTSQEQARQEKKKKSIADREEELPARRSLPKDRTVIPASGREVFTPNVLDRGRVYRVKLFGCIALESKSNRDAPLRFADAMYATDDQGNYTQSHDRLVLDTGAVVRSHHKLVVDNRAEHRYELLIDGDGKPLGVYFMLEEDTAEPVGEGLTVVVEPEVVDTVPLRVRDRKAQREKAKADLARKVSSAKTMTDVLVNWGDKSFRENVVAGKRDDLLSRKKHIVNDMLTLLQDQADVVEKLAKDKPEAFERLTGRFKALIDAERLDAEEAAKEARESAEDRAAARAALLARRAAAANPRPKLTQEQFRARMIAWEEALAADKLAMIETALKTGAATRELLRAHGLEDEAIEKLLEDEGDEVTEALGRLEERRSRNGKKKDPLD